MCKILTQLSGSSWMMIDFGCVTSVRWRYLVARLYACSRSATVGYLRLCSCRRVEAGRSAGGNVSLDQVSRLVGTRNDPPPLPVLSVHTIFYLVDTITLFDGPHVYAKVSELILRYIIYR